MSTSPSPMAITIADFCKTFGVGRTTYKELVRDGKITRRYIGSHPVVDYASAVAWYNSLPTDTPANLKNKVRNTGRAA